MNEDPIAHFAELYRRALAEVPINPTAATLATVTPGGRPDARVILLKSFDAEGFVFYTNTLSRKGRELAANPYAALCFYWRELGVQVRVEGKTARVTEAEADAYFSSRPRGSQLGAWASQQSEPLDARATLVERVETLSKRYTGGDVPRPPHWSGYRLVPDRIEIWRDRPDRLHERTRFVLESDGWRSELLQP